jgi:hypothetical protein
VTGDASTASQRTSARSGSPTPGWAFTVVVALVSIVLTYLSVKVSESTRMDGLGARLDALGTRLDVANGRSGELEKELNKVRAHERAMWNLANEICHHLIEEEDMRAHGPSPSSPGNHPPGYIPGSQPQTAVAQRFHVELCSLMPADPGP